MAIDHNPRVRELVEEIQAILVEIGGDLELQVKPTHWRLLDHNPEKGPEDF